MIQLIQGYHITATEKRAIETMIDNGMTGARNRPDTKRYSILQGTPTNNGYIFKIQIGTKAKWTIGDIAKWRYSEVEIQHTKTKQ